MLQAIRQSRYRALVLLLLLVAQGLLLAADSLHFDDASQATAPAHHLQLAAADAAGDLPPTTDLPAHNEADCDHCCACHGHSGHLALFADLAPADLNGRADYGPVTRASFTSPPTASIYRPPIV